MYLYMNKYIYACKINQLTLFRSNCHPIVEKIATHRFQESDCAERDILFNLQY